jgi:ribosomal protein S18 acetylase RimI-like enzyme
VKINHRAYQVGDDDQRVRDFLSRTYASIRHPYTFLDPPNWEFIRIGLMKESGRRRIHLWELVEHPSKLLIGMLMYEKHRAKFSYLADPNYGDIHHLVCDWVETEHHTVQNERASLKCSVCETNDIQKAILTQRGYMKGKLDTIFRKRILDGTLPEIVLPRGIQVQDGGEMTIELLEQRALAENDTFGRAVTLDFLLKLRETPIYRPELDLVVTLPDGSITAFCAIWLDVVNNVGFIEPIGTTGAYRRRGFAKALLIEGFRRLQKVGAEIAYLGNMAENTAGNRLYEAVEMPVFDQEYLWQREF